MYLIRETLEETGLRCKFVEMIGFREIDNFYFGLNEIYFIGHLVPIDDNQQLKIDHYEIKEAKWFNKVI